MPLMFYAVPSAHKTKTLAVWLCILTFLMFNAAHAQDVPDRAHPRQVFLSHDIDANGRDRIMFVDMLTGEEREFIVAGSRYTVLQNAVMYHDAERDQIMLLSPDGAMRAHPFIQRPQHARRVDWIISSNGAQIAWTITEGTPAALITRTWIANIDGANIREVFVDVPREGLRAFPVAFYNDRNILYMDYQPDAIGDFTPLRQFAGLFSLNLDTRETRTLSGEPGCFCGAAISGGHFIRLTLSQDINGFGVRVVNLTSNTEQLIPSLNLSNFTQGGDVIISPDGTRAIYTLAQVRGFGTPEQSIQTIFALVNLENYTQVALTEPANTLFRPVAWTDDGASLIVTSPSVDGTWKVELSDGALRLIAEASFIGTLIPSNEL